MFLDIYLRNTLRLAGLLAVAVGIVLLGAQWWSVLHEDAPPAFYLCSPVGVPRWLFHAAPVIQGLLGWPWILCVDVPLPLLLLAGGALALHV